MLEQKQKKLHAVCTECSRAVLSYLATLCTLCLAAICLLAVRVSRRSARARSGRPTSAKAARRTERPNTHIESTLEGQKETREESISEMEEPYKTDVTNSITTAKDVCACDIQQERAHRPAGLNSADAHARDLFVALDREAMGIARIKRQVLPKVLRILEEPDSLSSMHEPYQEYTAESLVRLPASPEYGIKIARIEELGLKEESLKKAVDAIYCALSVEWDAVCAAKESPSVTKAYFMAYLLAAIEFQWAQCKAIRAELEYLHTKAAQMHALCEAWQIEKEHACQTGHPGQAEELGQAVKESLIKMDGIEESLDYLDRTYTSERDKTARLVDRTQKYAALYVTQEEHREHKETISRLSSLCRHTEDALPAALRLEYDEFK
ncbi:hypothetical protein NEAUS06_2262 [Nematocida ausubeli]|nr:hypothetical protein NEAUS06_2262 [Nematocida ausubeli]